MALTSARTAFVGRTLRGPVNQPLLMTSFAQFQHHFGGLWQPSPLSYAVEQFFDHGGREATVVRIVNGARAATLTLTAGEAALNLRALRPGTREYLRASVDYDNLQGAGATDFNLTVQRVLMQGTGQVVDQEIFRGLSTAIDSPRYVCKALSSSLMVKTEGPVPTCRPAVTVDSQTGLATGYVVSDSSGDDGGPLTDYDVIGSQIERTGLFALDSVDYFNLLCVPPLSREQDVGPAVLLVAARYCRGRRALLIADPPADWHTADEALHGLKNLHFSSENAFMYFPRVLAYDKLRGRFESFAPCGAVAGMLARRDQINPVWGPPRSEEAVLRQGYRPSCLVPEGKRMRLAGAGVNTLQAVRSASRLSFPPRTLAMGAASGADRSDLAARRLVLFILSSVERGTRWMVGRVPHPRAAALAVAQVRAFFARLHAAGAFGAIPADEAFFVTCEPDLVLRQQQLLIGFAGAAGVDFHTFRMSVSAGGQLAGCTGQVVPATFNRLSISIASELTVRTPGPAGIIRGSSVSVSSLLHA